METVEESFLIEPIIPASGITLLHGSTDAGKSTLLLTLQDHISQGKDFFGMKTTQARVLYINLDMPQRLFIARVNKAEPTLQGLVLPFVDAFNVLGEGFKNTLTYSELKAAATGVDLLIFDTLTDVVAGNDDETCLNAYHEFRRWFPDKAILFSHHDRKAKWNMKEGGFANPNDEDAFGTGFWRAKAQSALHLYKINDVVRELKHTKSHCGEKYPATLRLILDNTGTRMLPHDTTLEGARKWVEAEKKLSEETKGWSELSDTEKVRAVSEATGVSERTAWKWKKTLGEAGVV